MSEKMQKSRVDRQATNHSICASHRRAVIKDMNEAFASDGADDASMVALVDAIKELGFLGIGSVGQ